ncbi:MAG: FecR domain-containing protein, partial [Gammaproteobacteria bacterium]|nr:FecR domain-containing protein [Gammaproteobacteria bacterium]
MHPRSVRLFAAGIALLVQSGMSAQAAPEPRTAPTAGSVVSVRSGEEIEFVEAPSWRDVEVLQDVKAGDVVRTNALGQLAILFNDHTQVRVARNSTLVVKSLGEGDTQLALTRGTIFARAARGGTGVTVETPAAAAAIRGTDWSMTVDGERTSLVVLEGEVEFYNPQGSVTVREGEAAAATLGQAPTRVVIVDSDDREQMLVHLSLRGAFGALPSSGTTERDLRQERARLAAVPADALTAEDRVLAAEIALAFEGRPAMRAALTAARGVPLSASQEARLLAVEAALAGAEGRYAEAARLFEAAMPRLDSGRRTLARYQAYFARALADPSLAEPPPQSGGASREGVYGDVIIAAFLEGPNAALELMQRYEARFGDEASYQAA